MMTKRWVKEDGRTHVPMATAHRTCLGQARAEYKSATLYTA